SPKTSSYRCGWADTARRGSPCPFADGPYFGALHGCANIASAAGVAVGHPEDVRTDRHEPSTGSLSAWAAGGPDVEHDRKTGATVRAPREERSVMARTPDRRSCGCAAGGARLRRAYP